jgi:hypothetical protein
MSQLQMTAEEKTQFVFPLDSPAAPATLHKPAATVESSVPEMEKIPIASEHIRADELMAALAAIDARKNKKATPTVPLGDALEQMHTDVTPEEVWQEIYSERLKERKFTDALRAKAAQRRKRFWTIGGPLAAIFTTAVLLRFFAGGPIQLSQISTGMPPTNGGTQTPKTSISNNSPKPIPVLSLLQDGGVVRMSLKDLSALRGMINRSQNGAAFATEELRNARIDPSHYKQDDWMVYFDDGNIYLRGWIVIPPDADKVALLAQKVTIYNRDDHPAMKRGTGRPITARTDGVRNYASDSDGTFQAIEARLTRLDGEAWKTWQPLRIPESPGVPSSQAGADL